MLSPLPHPSFPELYFLSNYKIPCPLKQKSMYLIFRSIQKSQFLYNTVLKNCITEKSQYSKNRITQTEYTKTKLQYSKTAILKKQY